MGRAAPCPGRRRGPAGEGPQPLPAPSGDIPLPTHPAPSGASAGARGEEKGPALMGHTGPGCPRPGGAPARCPLRPAATSFCQSPLGSSPAALEPPPGLLAAASSFPGPAERASVGAGPLPPEVSLAVVSQPSALTFPKQPECSQCCQQCSPRGARRGAGTRSARLPAPPAAAPSGRGSSASQAPAGAPFPGGRQPQGMGLVPGQGRKPMALLTKGCHPAPKLQPWKWREQVWGLKRF